MNFQLHINEYRKLMCDWAREIEESEAELDRYYDALFEEWLQLHTEICGLNEIVVIKNLPVGFGRVIRKYLGYPTII